jgi:EAL domain-containing protein (putative c-di-GMP-specific phosphodiesterase class I)
VESQAVLTELARIGIGFAQGYYIAEPQSTSGFPYLRSGDTASRPILAIPENQ